MLKYRHMPHLTDYIARSLRGPVMSSTQKRAILQVRIREEDKQHAEHLYDAMGTSLAEAVRLFVAQSILMRKLPFQPVAVRSKDGTAASMDRSKHTVTPIAAPRSAMPGLSTSLQKATIRFWVPRK